MIAQSMKVGNSTALIREYAYPGYNIGKREYRNETIIKEKSVFGRCLNQKVCGSQVFVHMNLDTRL